MLVDTHCHLDFPEFDNDRDQAIQRSRETGVDYLVNIGSSLEGSRKSLELAKKYQFIYASVGLHPHEADNFNKNSQDILSNLARQDKVAAIGEIGLDYFRNYSRHDNQKRLFRHLLELARSLNLPVVIHNRQAQNDTLAILKEFTPQNAVVHCFSGDKSFLQACLDLGFFISFTCNITYKKACDLRELVRLTPLDRLMLETDAPFLPPEELRGKRNEPMHVLILAEKISAIKNRSLADVAETTSRNAVKFFNLK